MKMIVLIYLEGDERCVDRLLSGAGVPAFSRFSVEGHGLGGKGGWYPEAAPYRSRLVFTFLDEATAGRIMEAVRSCKAVEDPRHPIRAFQLDVEGSAFCAATTLGHGGEAEGEG